MTLLSIPIQDRRDIIEARNVLRRTAEAQRWPPFFRARTAAALTALAEMVLFSETSSLHSLTLEIRPLLQDDRQGLEMGCRAPSDEGYLQKGLARVQLERASDHIEFVTGADGSYIIVHLWL